MILLEALSPTDKNGWIAALWSNIFFANPAKRPGGVSYPVSLQVLLNEADFFIA